VTLTHVDTDELSWESVPDSWEGKTREDESGVRFKRFSFGSLAISSGMIVEFEPGHHEIEHSHQEDELFFILDGEMDVSGRRATAGTLVFIEGGTRYSLDTGADGSRYLRLEIQT